MAVKKKEELEMEKEVLEEKEVGSETETVKSEKTKKKEEKVVEEKTYVLNNVNFTAVGDKFLSLCHNSVTVKTSDTLAFNSAEEQVKLGVLKVAE